MAGVEYVEKDSEGKLIHDGFFAGPENYINMIEFEGSDISESKIIDLFLQAEKDIKKLIDFQKTIIQELQKPKVDIDFTEPSKELVEKVKNIVSEKIRKSCLTKNDWILPVKEYLLKTLKEEGVNEESLQKAEYIFDTLFDETVHEIIHHSRRADGRALDEIRELHAETQILDLTHGLYSSFVDNLSSLVVTLGLTASAQTQETF